MLKLTKIFHFEMAHALYGYQGACKHIHGHSYELHVTLTSSIPADGYLSTPGLLIDFKEIKKLVTDTIIRNFDHRLVLSKEFLHAHPAFSGMENLFVFEVEPTAENLLLCFRNTLLKNMPENTLLAHLKLFETKDSYAEWEGDLAS